VTEPKRTVANCLQLISKPGLRGRRNTTESVTGDWRKAHSRRRDLRNADQWCRAARWNEEQTESINRLLSFATGCLHLEKPLRTRRNRTVYNSWYIALIKKTETTRNHPQQNGEKSAATALNALLASACTQRPSSELHGATRQQQAIAKTPAKWSAHQIPSAIVVFVVLVFKV
jgi:hypothetical protein